MVKNSRQAATMLDVRRNIIGTTKSIVNFFTKNIAIEIIKVSMPSTTIPGIESKCRPVLHINIIIK